MKCPPADRPRGRIPGSADRRPGASKQREADPYKWGDDIIGNALASDGGNFCWVKHRSRNSSSSLNAAQVRL